MPVPSSIDELSITPAENSPPGSEAVFPMLDDYLRTHAAFIAQTKLMAENAKKRENHTGTQAIETVAGLEEALTEALDERIAKSSDTGVMYVPEGTDAQRPPLAEIPEGVAAVRGNSTSLTDYFLELWNRRTEVWDALASRFWVIAKINELINNSIGFTIIYPNGGTAEAPASISSNQRFVETSPFPNHHVMCEVEIKTTGEWFKPGWSSNNTAAYGVSVGMNGDSIVVQSGITGVTAAGNVTGATAAGLSVTTSAQTRLKIRKLKGAE